eukprot:4366519-Prymnesium_polylepis.2
MEQVVHAIDLQRFSRRCASNAIHPRQMAWLRVCVLGGAAQQRQSALAARVRTGLWPMVRRKAVSSATRALRCLQG